MKLVDYTGKLNSHEEYLALLKGLEKKCAYIEFVFVDETDTRLIEKLNGSIMEVSSKNRWWGTKSSGRSKIYKIKASKELFVYLKRFETFCKYYVSSYEDRVEYTDFGINDIAFFDGGELPLLYTTTHEGYITVRDDLL